MYLFILTVLAFMNTRKYLSFTFIVAFLPFL